VRCSCDLHAHPREFDRVRRPALALCAAATVASEFPWLTPDSARYAAAQDYVEQVRRPFQLAQCARFRAGVPNRRTVAVDGPHYLFILRQEEVMRAMGDFLR
jgi:hypothetical protein